MTNKYGESDRGFYSGKSMERLATGTDLRLGQCLFNELPSWAKEPIRGLVFDMGDPFFRVLTVAEVDKWVDEHLIFDHKDDLLAVFNGGKMLAERPVY
jgi:hypothetical protein